MQSRVNMPDAVHTTMQGVPAGLLTQRARTCAGDACHSLQATHISAATVTNCHEALCVHHRAGVHHVCCPQTPPHRGLIGHRILLSQGLCVDHRAGASHACCS